MILTKKMTVTKLEDITPIGNRVLIEVAYEDELFDRETLLVRPTKRLTIFGIVRAVGPDVTMVKPGEAVVFDRWNQGQELKYEDRPCKVFVEDDIIAVVEL